MAEKEPKYKVKVPKLNATKRSYDFSLSLPGMISAVGAGVLALTFFFIMGILIGRGYRPEADIPQLEPIMPSKERLAITEPVQPKVLKPEELEYQDRLKSPAESVMDEVKPEAKPEKKTETPKPEKKAEETKPETKPEPKKAEQKPAPKPAVETPAPKPGEPVFDYIYQVAAFRKVEQAEAFAKKLEDSGLRTLIASGSAKGSTWYRVQVLHYGTPSSTDSMRAVLAKHGIKKPLLKKKTQVQ